MSVDCVVIGESELLTTDFYRFFQLVWSATTVTCERGCAQRLYHVSHSLRLVREVDSERKAINYLHHLVYCIIVHTLL